MSDKNDSFVGNYHLLAKLARGDIGDLYLARRQGAGGFEKLVIIKRIHQLLTGDPTLKKIFIDETFGSGSVEHPNIRQVYEFGRHGQHFYIALEYLEGIPLVKFILSRRTHPALAEPRLLASVFAQICQGLDSAHKKTNAYGKKIIHGNLNPRAIFITSNGNAKVLDLDIADMRSTLSERYGFVKQTFAYMAPEECRGDPSSVKTDVFSLGVVAWEAIWGRRLFQKKSKDEIVEAIKHFKTPDQRPSSKVISKALETAINKAIAPAPKDRYDSIGEFGEALLHAAYVEGPPLTSLSIAALVQSSFSKELDEQISFVKRAREKHDNYSDQEFENDYTRVDSNPSFSIEKNNQESPMRSSTGPISGMLKEVEADMPELFEWQSVPSMGTPEQIKELTQLSKVEIDLPQIFEDDVATVREKLGSEHMSLEKFREAPISIQTKKPKKASTKRSMTEHLSKTLDVDPKNKKMLLLIAIAVLLIGLSVLVFSGKGKKNDTPKDGESKATVVDSLPS